MTSQNIMLCLFLFLPEGGAVTMTPPVSLSLGGLLLLGLVSSQTVNPSVEDLSNRNADFAARLYRAIASRTDENIFLSTLALSTALSALLGATSGATREQLLQGLTLTGLDPETIPGRSGLGWILDPSDSGLNLSNPAVCRSVSEPEGCCPAG